MHPELVVGAVAKDLLAARPESVSAATNCSGVAVVVALRRMVGMRCMIALRP